MVRPNTSDQNPRGVNASPALQLTIAVACALVVAQAVDAVTAAHVLVAVLTLFTSFNRAALPPVRRCARCGQRQ
ncbi:MAG: hypothetical protein E6R02_00120 [Gammaproteobacteria bacterium]|nr:MAG: hypothetical protein E6R02_00120 [Gammaproteobacteria bacterium]